MLMSVCWFIVMEVISYTNNMFYLILGIVIVGFIISACQALDVTIKEMKGKRGIDYK